jgi:syntaxin 5
MLHACFDAPRFNGSRAGGNTPQYIQSYAEFMTTARTIGKNIGSTCTKLEKLTLLAKSKSFFNDWPAEIQELKYIIKEDLNSLNRQIAKLQEVAWNQRQLQQCGHNLLSHSSSVVLALQSTLASMSTEFKQALAIRTENLKQEKCRQDQYFQGPSCSSFPPSALSGHHQGSVLLTDEVSIHMEGYSPLPPVIQKRAMIYDETDNYLQSRAATMQNIESTIVDLGRIFQDLAHIVQEQEEMVDRIDAHVQDAELNVEAAHNEILRYLRNITSNRWLMIKIFCVLTFFLFFFTVFLA